jgi:hypothetical protein
MVQQSSIDRLPDDIREKLQELLRDPRVTQLAATARLNEILAAEGHPDRLSKSAINRYDIKMRQAGDRLRQSREVAQMWIGKLGATPQGQVGHLVNEILRTLAFDLSLKLQETDLTAETIPEVVEMLRGLSLSAMRLEKAASENVKREAEIKKQAAVEAATAMESEAKRQGASAASIDSMRAAIMRELAA